MKGLLAQMYADDEPGVYTDVQVLQSGAGFYIGTMFVSDGTELPKGMEEPGSRESEEYWRTREEAAQALSENSWTQRLHA